MKKLATLALAGLLLSSCASKVSNIERTFKGIDSLDVVLTGEHTYYRCYDTIYLVINHSDGTHDFDVVRYKKHGTFEGHNFPSGNIFPIELASEE